MKTLIIFCLISLAALNAQGTPVYVVLFTHIEDDSPAGTLGTQQSKDNYMVARSKMIEMANLAKRYNVKWVFQPDWKILLAVLIYEDTAATRLTNGKNFLRYIKEDLGVVIDAHSHEGSGYNYTDVAHLLDSLGVGGTTVIGGHIWDPNLPQYQGWDRFRVPLYGAKFPWAVWRGDILMGSGTPNHVNDPHVSGVWRPKDKFNYFIDDPNGNIFCVGQYNGDISSTNELINLYKSGKVSPQLMLTSTYHIQPAVISGLNGITAIEDTVIKPLVAWRDKGEVVITDFTSLINDWKTKYSSVPYIYDISMPNIINTNSNPVAGGSTSGGGTFIYGQTDSVIAVANPGYTFKNWTEGGELVSPTAVYIFSITASRTLTANFNYTPVLTLTAPRGGEILFSDSSFNIIWQSAGVQNINIDFSSNGGASWNEAVRNLAASAGSCSWKVPHSISSQCKIKIYDAVNTLFSSASNVFIIKESVFPPILNSPKNYSTNIALPVTLIWHKAVGAVKYYLEVAADSLFSNLAVNDSSLIDTSYTLSSLLNGTKYFWRVTSSTGSTLSIKSYSWNFTTANSLNNITGIISYANASNTPITNCKIYLTGAAGIIDSVVTGELGNFTFLNVAGGSYNLLPFIKAEWGGVNSTDALQIRRYLVGLTAFDSLQSKAADVNGSKTINSTDALFIRRRITGEVSVFPKGDWVCENPVIILSGVSQNINIHALCTGDVNGSFTPVIVLRPIKKEHQKVTFPQGLK